jgi:hypothetical protein
MPACLLPPRGCNPGISSSPVRVKMLMWPLTDDPMTAEAHQCSHLPRLEVASHIFEQEEGLLLVVGTDDRIV